MRSIMSSELETRRIKAGGYTIDVQGNFLSAKPSFVLIHGIGVSGRYFLPFADELAKDYNVVVMNLPGYGKTPKPERVLSTIELAEAVVDFLVAYKVAQPILVGHSMGCQIAAQVARRHPSLVYKLILLGPTVNKWERFMIMPEWESCDI